MKTWLKLGIGIGCGLGALWLLYMGTKMLAIQGLALQPGLMILSGVALIVAAAKFVNEAESERVIKTIPPMPPNAPARMETKPRAKPAKKAAKKKKGRR